VKFITSCCNEFVFDNSYSAIEQKESQKL